MIFRSIVSIVLVLIVAIATFGIAFLLFIDIGVPQNEGVQALLASAEGTSMADGANVGFNTLVNDQSDAIDFNPDIGEFTITKPGNYYVDWSIAVDSPSVISFAHISAVPVHRVEGLQVSDLLAALSQDLVDFIQPDLFIYHQHR